MPAVTTCSDLSLDVVARFAAYIAFGARRRKASRGSAESIAADSPDGEAGDWSGIVRSRTDLAVTWCYLKVQYLDV